MRLAHPAGLCARTRGRAVANRRAVGAPLVADERLHGDEALCELTKLARCRERLMDALKARCSAGRAGASACVVLLFLLLAATASYASDQGKAREQLQTELDGVRQRLTSEFEFRMCKLMGRVKLARDTSG